MTILSLVRTCLENLPILKPELTENDSVLEMLLDTINKQGLEWISTHKKIFENRLIASSFYKDSIKNFKAAFEVGDTLGMRVYIDGISHVDEIPFLNKNQESPLQFACREGDKELALALIKKGADINAKDPQYGNHALNFACMSQNAALCLELIEQGAYIEVVNLVGQSTLYLALNCNKDNVGQKLLEMGATPESKDPKYSPLLAACKRGCLETARLLLDLNADLNINNDEGSKYFRNGASTIGHVFKMTPLHLASTNGWSDGWSDLVSTLIGLGANLESVNSDGCTPLFCAVKYNKLDVALNLIEKGASIATKDSNGASLLHTVCTLSYVDPHPSTLTFIEMLVKKGVDIDGLNKEGQTPLLCAIQLNGNRLSKEMALTLIELGARIDIMTAEKSSLLHLACAYGYIDIASALIKRGNSIDTPNGEGETPLSIAIRQEQFEIALKLMDCGANVHLKDKKGRSLLHILCNGGFYSDSPLRLKLIERLIKEGVDVNGADHDGNSPLCIALISVSNCIPEMELLIQNGATVDFENGKKETPLFLALRFSKEDAASFLLKQGANVHHKNYLGQTVLFLGSKNSQIVTELLDKGVDPNAQDNQGRTAIFEISSNEVRALLVKRGASLEIRDNEGKTPFLHLCNCEFSQEDLIHFIELGAKTDVCDNFGNTPLHYLALNRYFQRGVIFKLLEEGCRFDVKNKKGLTPLFYALKSKKDLLSEKLISMGADIFIRDKEGNTTLLLACKGMFFKLALTLLERGVPLATRNLKGETPLKVALLKVEGKKLVEQALKEFPVVRQLLIENEVTALLPEKLLEESNILEFLFLVGDYFLAHQVIPRMDPKKFISDLNSLREKYPDFSFQWLIESSYSIAPAHYSIDLAKEIEMPKSAPSGMTLEKTFKLIREFFDAINFTDPHAPAYKDPSKLTNDGSFVTVETLKSFLKDLINHLEKRDLFQAVPEDASERKAYYDKLEILITWTLFNLSQFDKKDADIRASILIRLAIACGHCGTRYRDGALEAFKDSSEQRETRIENLSFKISLILQALREFSFAQMLTFDDNVHEHNFYLKLIGKERGISSADAAYDDPLWRSEETKEEGLKRFDALHTPTAMIDRIQEAIHGQEIKFLEFLQMWLKENAPKDWMPAAEMLEEIEDNLYIERRDIETDEKARGSAYLWALTDMSEKPRKLKKEVERQVAIDLLLKHGHLN